MDASEDKRGRPEASPWVARFIEGVAAGGHVLDIACGGGRNTRLALAQGLRVTGVDRDLSDVADLMNQTGVTLIEADLEDGSPFPLGRTRFDGVVVTNYLWRPVLADIVAAVADDGVLIYETFARGQERLGRPANPDFLLKPNELIDAVRPRLTVVAFEHGVIGGAKPRRVQRIAACGPGHRWVEAAPASLV
ncbi:MAG: class I SAM-dependent methyltransferase [Methyloligellaceae bacterium]